MFISSERLEVPGFSVFDNVQTLIAGHTIVQNSGTDWNRHRSVRNDLRLLPATILGPINTEHVVCESLAKSVLARVCWLSLGHSIRSKFSVFGIKSAVFCSILHGDRILRL
jgi:hypothetical protein